MRDLLMGELDALRHEPIDKRIVACSATGRWSTARAR
jgi:hypothetical protein